MRNRGPRLFALALAVILLSGCRARGPGWAGQVPLAKAEKTEFMMDTVITITAYGPKAAEAVNNAMAEMRRIAALMNADDPKSEVSRINQNAGKRPVRVSEDTFRLLKLAQRYSELSGGAFDVTVRPLVVLWGIGKKDKYVPDAAAIERARALVNWRDLILDEKARTVYLRRPGMGIDLGGAAKGYAADRAREVLLEHGVRSALIDAGGNIWALGRRPDGEPWRIGIRNPRPEHGGELLAVVPSEDLTLVTSGDYERYFIRDGVRYHHIFDPRTGRPARSTISATIIGRNSAEADILSTALFVLGPEQGLALIRKLGNLEAVVVTPEERIVSTSNLEDKLEIVRQEGGTGDKGR
ncbi:MAG: FAD:protein transferase [Bacillota bacterium]|nr:FAD:protein transferase [Bacillota bacterium]MDK2924883.1 FAD:protein transferase [Bacillota bacterium]